MTYSPRFLWASILIFSTLECANTQTEPSNTAGSTPAPSNGIRIVGFETAPHVIYALKPEYSEEARREKIEGICVVGLIVGLDGVPRNVRVRQTLRPDLDAKAIQAVEKWRFEPAMKDDKPVTVGIHEDVEFRLESDNPKIRELQRQADAGNPKAQLELSKDYFQGVDVGKSESLGFELLREAAEHGLPEAQYEMGEYRSGKDTGRLSCYHEAFVWYSLAERNGYKGSAQKVKKIGKTLSRDSIADAEYKVKNWRPSSNSIADPCQ